MIEIWCINIIAYKKVLWYKSNFFQRSSIKLYNKKIFVLNFNDKVLSIQHNICIYDITPLLKNKSWDS